MSEGIDWPATIGAIMAALTPLGAGIGFIWSKVERRFSEIEKKQALCEEREALCERRAARQTTAIELLWNALEQANPAARELRRAKHLLDDLKRDTNGAAT